MINAYTNSLRHKFIVQDQLITVEVFALGRVESPNYVGAVRVKWLKPQSNNFIDRLFFFCVTFQFEF